MLVSQDADLKSENRSKMHTESKPTIMPHLAITETDQTRSRPPSTRTRSLRTTDFDELGAALPGWGIALIQLGRGPFDGRVVLAQHGRFQLYEFEGNRTILARGAVPQARTSSMSSTSKIPLHFRRPDTAAGNDQYPRAGRAPGSPHHQKYRSTGLNVDAQFVRRVPRSFMASTRNRSFADLL